MDRDKKKYRDQPIIGITLGDINGVGPEVVIKALNDNRITKYLTPVVYGSGSVLSYYQQLLDLERFSFSSINDVEKINYHEVNVFDCWQEEVQVTPGVSNHIGGKCAFKALEQGVQDLQFGKIAALVTAPINKHNIQQKEFQFPGHTEYLAEKASVGESLMFMISERCKVGVVTGHIPIKEVPTCVTKESVRNKLRAMIASLKKDFGILKPKIAVLGLNPHAGENGLLGSEESEIIKPAIETIKEKGDIIMGPYPADGFFGSDQYQKFDAVLGMYHDQGLIPFKSLSFGMGVNFTAGLPFVRTSPDHGTAYALAGKNCADERSMRTAIFAALDISNQRKINS